MWRPEQQQQPQQQQPQQHRSGRAYFEVMPGVKMEYELFLPAGHNPRVPTPFVVSVSGASQQHVNGFSRKLISPHWGVAVPLRPDGAPLLFEGSGTPGSGVWFLRQFCKHLTERFAVEKGRFILCGVSNGGSAVLRFATLWPELVRGVVVVAGSLTGLARGEEMARLSGIPIEMFVGRNDEYGFCPNMVELEIQLKSLGLNPAAHLHVFEQAGHVCSPHIDSDSLHGKLRLMFLRAQQLEGLQPTDASSLQALLPDLFAHRDELVTQLTAFAERLGIRSVSTAQAPATAIGQGSLASMSRVTSPKASWAPPRPGSNASPRHNLTKEAASLSHLPPQGWPNMRAAGGSVNAEAPARAPSPKIKLLSPVHAEPAPAGRPRGLNAASPRRLLAVPRPLANGFNAATPPAAGSLSPKLESRAAHRMPTPTPVPGRGEERPVLPHRVRHSSRSRSLQSLSPRPPTAAATASRGGSVAMESQSSQSLSFLPPPSRPPLQRSPHHQFAWSSVDLSLPLTARPVMAC